MSKVQHLVIGGDGMIGAALAQALRADGEEVHATTRRPDRAGESRPFLDLSTREEWLSEGTAYTTAYLCAAVARLNDCFNDPQGSSVVNTDHLAILARRLASAGTGVIFLSSNQVLDGRDPFPDERTPVAPANIYGHQKARTEQAMAEIAEQFPAVPIAILRLSKVLPPDMPLFAEWAVRLRAGQPVTAAQDMSLAPVPLRLAVEALRRLASGRHRGLFQLSSSSEIHYVDAARHLCRRLGRDEALVLPVSSVASGYLKEAPVRHTIMDSGALSRATGVQPLPPYAALDEAFDSLGGVTSGSMP